MKWIDKHTYLGVNGVVYRELEDGDEYSDYDIDSHNEVIHDVLRAIEGADAAVIAKVEALLQQRPKYKRGPNAIRMYQPVDIP